MALNPFKESNLNDLQKNIFTFLSNHCANLISKIKLYWSNFIKKGNERITLMFIPHSEKRIINFHISIFTISFIIGIVIVTITITSILIINHSSTIKEVSKLKKYGKYSKIQKQKYTEEIDKLYALLKQLKLEMNKFASIQNKRPTSLWAKGGIHNPNPKFKSDGNTPPESVLNIEEIDKDLKRSKDIFKDIKKYLAYRKKIIENTPSIWPVDGHIISRFGLRESPFTFTKKYHYGIDIEAFPGAEIHATAPGKVIDRKWDSVLGLTISIKHKYGFVTTYSHCQRVTVKKGQKVSKGETIGYVGRTGKTTRYTCYYQIKIGTAFVDPMPYLNRIIW